MFHEGAQGLAESVLARCRRDDLQSLARCAVRVLERRVQCGGNGAFRDGRLFGIIQHLEPRGHGGFKRELMQQALAKPVDGLNLQAARCFNRAGKQPPRFQKLGAVGRLPGHLGNGGGELRIAVRHPCAQGLKDFILHVGGSRLGEGHAENAGGVSPRQQQAHHAAGEHGGFARTRVGADPHGVAGVCRLALVV